MEGAWLDARGLCRVLTDGGIPRRDAFIPSFTASEVGSSTVSDNSMDANLNTYNANLRPLPLLAPPQVRRAPSAASHGLRKQVAMQLNLTDVDRRIRDHQQGEQLRRALVLGSDFVQAALAGGELTSAMLAEQFERAQQYVAMHQPDFSAEKQDVLSVRAVCREPSSVADNSAKRGQAQRKTSYPYGTEVDDSNVERLGVRHHCIATQEVVFHCNMQRG